MTNCNLSSSLYSALSAYLVAGVYICLLSSCGNDVDRQPISHDSSLKESDSNSGDPRREPPIVALGVADTRLSNGQYLLGLVGPIADLRLRLQNVDIGEANQQYQDWLRKAADQDHIEANYMLGAMGKDQWGQVYFSVSFTHKNWWSSMINGEYR